MEFLNDWWTFYDWSRISFVFLAQHQARKNYNYFQVVIEMKLQNFSVDGSSGSFIVSKPLWQPMSETLRLLAPIIIRLLLTL